MKSQIVVIDDEMNDNDNHDNNQEENKILGLDYLLRSYENVVNSNDERIAIQELDFKKTLKKNFYLTDDEGRRRVCQRFHTLPNKQNEFVILDNDIDFMQNL